MKLTTLTIAICAASWALAGTALAGHDDHPGLGVAASSAIRTDDLVHPDNRGGLRGVAGAEAEAIITPSGRPDGRPGVDGADIGHYQPTLVVAERRGFDWGDAGVGAFSALGACLLALSLAFATTSIRRRGRQTVA